MVWCFLSLAISNVYFLLMMLLFHFHLVFSTIETLLFFLSDEISNHLKKNAEVICYLAQVDQQRVQLLF